MWLHGIGHTRESLKFLQDYMPQYLKSQGFNIQRGVEQKSDSRKKHLDTQEIADKLHAKGIDVKPPTLAKYLNEFRRGKDRKTDTARPPEKTASAPRQKEKQPQTDAMKLKATAGSLELQQIRESGSLVIRPDTPRDEL